MDTSFSSIMEKLYCCCMTTPRRTALRKSLWHMAMCGLCIAPSVPQKHCDYTNSYKLITAGSPHIRISTTVSTSQSSSQWRPWRIVRHPLASLHCTQNTVILHPPHALQAICKCGSCHYRTVLAWIHTSTEVKPIHLHDVHVCVCVTETFCCSSVIFSAVHSQHILSSSRNL